MEARQIAASIVFTVIAAIYLVARVLYIKSKRSQYSHRVLESL